MDKRLRKYYYWAVLNFFAIGPVFMLVVFPDSVPKDVERELRIICGGAVLFLSAILQHWTYYDIYNPKTRLTTSSPNDRNASSLSLGR